MRYADLIEHFGSCAAAAAALKKQHRQTVYRWKNDGIPEVDQLFLERATRGALRAHPRIVLKYRTLLGLEDGVFSKRYCVVCLKEFVGGATAAYCSKCRSKTQKIMQRTQKTKVRRGEKCADCGKAAYAYDHRDYSKPSKVTPVCRGCNKKRGPADWSWLRRK